MCIVALTLSSRLHVKPLITAIRAIEFLFSLFFPVIRTEAVGEPEPQNLYLHRNRIKRLARILAGQHVKLSLFLCPYLLFEGNKGFYCS